MKDQFVTYEIAKRLKELGFNEPCLFAWCEIGGWNMYKRVKEPVTIILKTDGNPFGAFFEGRSWNMVIESNTKNKIQCSAPLWQQAIDWLREKHNKFIYVVPYIDEIGENETQILWEAKMCWVEEMTDETLIYEYFHEPQEAREAAITKALELIK